MLLRELQKQRTRDILYRWSHSQKAESGHKLQAIAQVLCFPITFSWRPISVKQVFALKKDPIIGKNQS